MDASKCECANCGTPLDGQFCHRCGQRNLEGRLNARHFVSQAFEEITSLDSKIGRTVWGLIQNPGQVSLRYIGGERMRYVNPLKYFLLVFALFYLAMVTTGGMDAFVDNTVNENGPIDTSPEQMLANSALELKDVLRDQLNFVVILILPLFALVLRWQFWRSGKNYVETLCMVFYAFAQIYLYSIFAVLAQHALGSFNNDVDVLIRTAVLAYTFKVFFEMGWIKAFVTSVLSVIIYTVIFIVTVVAVTALREFVAF
ncbi:MAG: hypothetical protein COB37_01330 [Kordiimonadales bacterium]|nr:MAG: hypothetical protein COB37_01330 [Kordiimonadales bacterium]